MTMRKRPRITAALGPLLWMVALGAPSWFGNMRHWTPLVHGDDHKDLARQALRYLLKSKLVSRDSPLALHRKVIETSCGLLDIVEREDRGGIPGRLEWDHSHFYDPIARRGLDDRRYVNALQEYQEYWERALIHAGTGNLGEGSRFLGYCCHLLQDMAVPAHTHCVMHGLSNRTADNLELVASTRRSRLGEPASLPRSGRGDTHVELFIAMGLESRGRESSDPGWENEIAGVLKRYYGHPTWTPDGWLGTYHGDFYYPYHRLLPSSPRIERGDMIVLRDFLMRRACERTALLIAHYAEVTETKDKG